MNWTSHFTRGPLVLEEHILLSRKALEQAGMLFGREEDDFSNI